MDYGNLHGVWVSRGADGDSSTGGVAGRWVIKQRTMSRAKKKWMPTGVFETPTAPLVKITKGTLYH